MFTILKPNNNNDKKTNGFEAIILCLQIFKSDELCNTIWIVLGLKYMLIYWKFKESSHWTFLWCNMHSYICFVFFCNFQLLKMMTNLVQLLTHIVKGDIDKIHIWISTRSVIVWGSTEFKTMYSFVLIVDTGCISSVWWRDH